MPEGIITPSSALVKAVLAHNTYDMTPGQYVSPQEISPRPNNVEGWGRVNLEESLFNFGGKTHVFVNDTTGLATGSLKAYPIQVGSTHPLRSVLAWSDPPGSLTYGGGLVNDLDLNLVTPTGSVVYPTNASQRGPTRRLSYTDDFIDWYYNPVAGTGYAAYPPPGIPRPAIRIISTLREYGYTTPEAHMPAILSRSMSTPVMRHPLRWLQAQQQRRSSASSSRSR